MKINETTMRYILAGVYVLIIVFLFWYMLRESRRRDAWRNALLETLEEELSRNRKRLDELHAIAKPSSTDEPAKEDEK